MGDERIPLAQELTPKAKEEGVRRMQAHLSQRSGRERSREDAAAAFDNLLGFYATVCEWQARAVLEDRERPTPPTPEPAPRQYRRKKSHRGQKAATEE
jgi:hypothetical protein